jgi:hypothetical protein
LNSQKGNTRSIDVPDGSWIEQEFQGDDLLGGLLNIHVLMNSAHGGNLFVHLSAMTSQDDPEPFIDQDLEDVMDLEAARWMNADYQHEMLGVSLDEYLDGHVSDDDNRGNFQLRPSFLGGETLEDYYEH